MYQTILVPLDGSKRAEAILPYVESLAQCYKAKMVLIEIIEPVSVVAAAGMPYYGMLDQQNYQQRTKEIEAYLAHRRGRLREKGIEAKTVVGHGPVVEEIINAAERENADLIAMASHGRTGLSKVFYGSVAAGVLHRIDRPLLLIRSLDA